MRPLQFRRICCTGRDFAKQTLFRWAAHPFKVPMIINSVLVQFSILGYGAILLRTNYSSPDTPVKKIKDFRPKIHCVRSVELTSQVMLLLVASRTCLRCPTDAAVMRMPSGGLLKRMNPVCLFLFRCHWPLNLRFEFLSACRPAHNLAFCVEVFIEALQSHHSALELLIFYHS